MVQPDQLGQMDAVQLRSIVAELTQEISRKEALIERQESELRRRQVRIEQLAHEMAVLKRWKCSARSEQLDQEQRSLLEEAIDADLQSMSLELDALHAEVTPATAIAKQAPKRMPLPAELPRIDFHHEPDSTNCACGCQMKRISEDVAEKLDYVPGSFTIHRHVRGKWACARCQVLIQAPVPAQVIDKGIPTAGLLAQVLVSKYADYAPLYRQEQMFARAGMAIAKSTLGQWVGECAVRLQPLVDALKEALLQRRGLHADETPVAMLKPGNGKTHRAYSWSWGTTAFDDLPAVIYEFAESRAGAHAKQFLGTWRGTLVCDDYAGYKALFDGAVTEAGCMAHARRKLHELWANTVARSRSERTAEASAADRNG